MSQSIPQHLINKNIYVVNYLTYLDQDQNKKFLYIAVKGDKMLLFQEAVKKGNFIAEDYGVILESGDDEADDMLKVKMEVQYKCDHSNMISLI